MLNTFIGLCYCLVSWFPATLKKVNCNSYEIAKVRTKFTMREKTFNLVATKRSRRNQKFQNKN